MTPLEQKIYQASKISLMILLTALIVFAILVHAPSGNASLSTAPFNTDTVEGWLTDRVASSIIGGLIGSVVGNSMLIILWKKYIK